MDAFRQVVRVVQAGTLVATVAFVLLLFVNEPSKPAPVPAVGTANAGVSIFATRCASCHASDGGGGFGPALRGGIVVQRYPSPADQAAVVANGRGSMPAFAGNLTPKQIQDVVDFTRTGLG